MYRAAESFSLVNHCGVPTGLYECSQYLRLLLEVIHREFIINIDFYSAKVRILIMLPASTMDVPRKCLNTWHIATYYEM